MKQIACFILVVFSSSLISCSSPDEETRIRQALDSLVKAVEERSVRQVQKYLTSDFRTAQQLNRQQLNTFMLIHFRQNPVIHIFTSDIQVALQQKKADVTFHALVTGSSNWLPERGRRFEVKSRWVLLEDGWKISRLNWQEF